MLIDFSKIEIYNLKLQQNPYKIHVKDSHDSLFVLKLIPNYAC